MIDTTQCYLIRNGCFLMMLRNKKQNDVNSGKWIAPGGKREPGETNEECAAREVNEETGFRVSRLTYRGRVCFRHCGAADEIIYVYSSDSFTGDLKESREGTLRWIPCDQIMALNLWEGDRLFLKYLTEGIMTPFSLILEYDQRGILIRAQEGEFSDE